MKILFVCLGNICRSPTAEAVTRTIAAQEAPELTLELDSAGTAAYHAGSAPDARTVAAAQDFTTFDLILAMDDDNLAVLRKRAPVAAQQRLRLFLEFAPEQERREVPDPYYGGPNGFEDVLDLTEAAARGLLAYLRRSSRAA